MIKIVSPKAALPIAGVAWMEIFEGHSEAALILEHVPQKMTSATRGGRDQHDLCHRFVSRQIHRWRELRFIGVHRKSCEAKRQVCEHTLPKSQLSISRHRGRGAVPLVRYTATLSNTLHSCFTTESPKRTTRTMLEGQRNVQFHGCTEHSCQFARRNRSFREKPTAMACCHVLSAKPIFLRVK